MNYTSESDIVLFQNIYMYFVSLLFLNDATIFIVHVIAYC